MFETLSDRLNGVLNKLTQRGALKEQDVREALREVRVALLEADVALPVVKSFIDHVTERAIGQEVLRSVTPGQQIIKIVHDNLVEVLGGHEAPETSAINLNVVPPAVVLMAGLQGSGKTTMTAKIGRRLTQRDKKKVLLASLDVRRPAAQEQLRVLGEQVGVATLPIVEGQMPVDIGKRAVEAGKLGGYDVVILDTAGRVTVDEDLMQEVADVAAATQPAETLLVVDSLTGQDAVNVAEQFGARLSLTGVALTRVDGDGRGGAALSMRAVTGCPIKFLGTGEKMEALEDFHADRVANRILDMGDIVGLVEKAAESIDKEKAAKIAKKMKKGTFDLEDLSDQLRQMRKLGGMGSILGLLPGIGKAKKQLAEANLDDKVLIHQEALISSMTMKERRNPKLLNASRKKRIAKGAGLTVQDVNRLIKMHRQMADMMKKMAKSGMKGMFDTVPENMELPEGEMPAGLGGSMAPGGLPGLGAPGGLPGLGGGSGLPPGLLGGRRKK
ncbi:MAG: signal recognition particle protein [Alphaproteobacteria bacterium]|nr:MAG: signal recognition particle protein [Alphaproteobacteria bacterium]